MELLGSFLFLLIPHLLCISDAQVSFVLTPANPVQALQGANATLYWDYTSNRPLTFAQWGTTDSESKLQTIIAQQKENGQVEYLSLNYRGRATIQGRASLILINVKESDSGQYGCHLTFDGVTIINSTSLIVSAQTTTTQAPTVAGLEDDENTNFHPIYLAFVAVVLILIVLVIVYFFISRRRRASEQLLHDHNYAPVVIDRRNSRTFGPGVNGMEMNLLPSTYTDIEVDKSLNEPYDSARQDYCVIPPLMPNPNEKDWEISLESVVLVKVIGKGAFGQVAKGMVKGFDKDSGNRLVAIKMLRDNPTDENRQDILAELNTMKKLPPHQNVIQLLGCVTKTGKWGLASCCLRPQIAFNIVTNLHQIWVNNVYGINEHLRNPVMVITEYVPYGDLLGFLRKSRGLQDNYYKDPDIKPQSSLRPKQLFGFAWDIANGMEFLASEKIVHRDLAARNVLVGDGQICKITDFGLARDVFQEDLYRRTATGRLPVKWTAFESLMHGICTTMSDVWSYGIVMYEIFTIGGVPYPKVDGKALSSLLQEGYRMPRPSHLDTKLYDVMKSCWDKKPEERPSFTKLRKMMKAMGDEKESYINLEDYDTKLYQSLDELDA